MHRSNSTIARAVPHSACILATQIVVDDVRVGHPTVESCGKYKLMKTDKLMQTTSSSNHTPSMSFKFVCPEPLSSGLGWLGPGFQPILIVSKPEDTISSRDI